MLTAIDGYAIAASSCPLWSRDNIRAVLGYLSRGRQIEISLIDLSDYIPGTLTSHQATKFTQAAHACNNRIHATMWLNTTTHIMTCAQVAMAVAVP